MMCSTIDTTVVRTVVQRYTDMSFNYSQNKGYFHSPMVSTLWLLAFFQLGINLGVLII
jgi:hypothetical protein